MIIKLKNGQRYLGMDKPITDNLQLSTINNQQIYKFLFFNSFTAKSTALAENAIYVKEGF